MLAMSLPPREAANPISAARAHAAPAAAPRLRMHRPGDAGRAAVEEFIRGVYRERYGADLRQFHDGVPEAGAVDSEGVGLHDVAFVKFVYLHQICPRKTRKARKKANAKQEQN